MNLFWKKLFGGITSTEKFEQEQIDFDRSIQSYFETENSAELQEYKKLHDIINSKEFQDKRQLLLKRKYKDSDEYKTLTKYNKLRNNKTLQSYFSTVNSKDLNDYLEYKASPEYFETLNNTKTEKQKYFQRFEKSKEFKNYVRYNDSYVIKEYEDLCAKISTDEFKKANDFWQDKHRWMKSEESVIEKRYVELQQHPNIVSYLKHAATDMEKYRTRKVTFFDTFNNGNFEESYWNAGYNYQKPLIGNFSYSNEIQANNGGKNVLISNGTLKLATKHEKATSITWTETKGFIEKQFDYTADVIQTADTFSQKQGVFQAKLRAKGHSHNVLWLGSEKRLPYIQIAHIHDKSIRVGMIDSKGRKYNEEIKGLNPADFFIYTLIWNERELIWKINNAEVYRMSNNIPSNEMYLGLNSYLPENEKAGEGIIEIEWIKIYNQ